jgi:hypothetical protein
LAISIDPVPWLPTCKPEPLVQADPLPLTVTKPLEPAA